jgi:hypothetical protein
MIRNLIVIFTPTSNKYTLENVCMISHIIYYIYDFKNIHTILQMQTLKTPTNPQPQAYIPDFPGSHKSTRSSNMATIKAFFFVLKIEAMRKRKMKTDESRFAM